jgi:[ribosomal protein S5]-alanine N-acetyltransferase
LKAITMFYTIEAFETDRMIAKRITKSDFEDLVIMHQDEEAMATLGGMRSVEETRENLEWNLKQWQDNGFGLWIFRSKITGQLIGRGGIRRVPIRDVEEIELGFALMPEYWGQGLATEMAKASTEVAFEKLRLRSLVSFTLTTNLASQHVIEKTGFKYEKDIELGGEPHVLYRLSVGDYCKGLSDTT